MQKTYEVLLSIVFIILIRGYELLSFLGLSPLLGCMHSFLCIAAQYFVQTFSLDLSSKLQLSDKRCGIKNMLAIRGARQNLKGA